MDPLAKVGHKVITFGSAGGGGLTQNVVAQQQAANLFNQVWNVLQDT